MANIIGYEPNQIPVNGFLGELAYQNSSGATIDKIQSKVGITTNLELQPNGGGVVVGIATAPLGTTATRGFFYLPTCAGAPTGVAQTVGTGAVPMVVDTTNSRLYIRIGSTWKYASLT
jgi:hypothetical protein